MEFEHFQQHLKHHTVSVFAAEGLVESLTVKTSPVKMTLFGENFDETFDVVELLGGSFSVVIG